MMKQFLIKIYLINNTFKQFIIYNTYMIELDMIESNITLTDLDDISTIIKTKYQKKLQNYRLLVDNNLLKQNQFIYYIDLYINTIQSGIVDNIIINKKGRICLLTLRGRGNKKNNTWNIDIHKYHIFIPNEKIKKDKTKRNILLDLIDTQYNGFATNIKNNIIQQTFQEF